MVGAAADGSIVIAVGIAYLREETAERTYFAVKRRRTDVSQKGTKQSS